MADSLADALPREIQRVTAMKEHWIKEAEQFPDLGATFAFGITFMGVAIAEGVEALGSGDVLRMLRAYEQLKGYRDE